MGDGSHIEWTEATWNPVTGCTRVSAGCDHCYAVRETHRHASRLDKYAGLTVLNARGERHFNGQVKCHEDLLDVPLRWRTPRRIFVNSMSDLFHPSVPFEFIDKVFAVMALCPHHTFQVLTKRPERMAEYLSPARAAWVWSKAWNVADWIGEGATRGTIEAMAEHRSKDHVEHWPLPNVWLMTSAENQAALDERMPWLMKCPAAVLGLSLEPLLGPIDLAPWLEWGSKGPPWLQRRSEHPDDQGPHNSEGWVIVGGESGPGARPMHPDWARSIRDQCVAAGVPFFFKQWGEYFPAPPASGTKPTHFVCEAGHFDKLNDDRIAKHRDGDGCFASTIGVARVGKKAAGRLLDGRTWDEFPATSGAGDRESRVHSSRLQEGVRS